MSQRIERFYDGEVIDRAASAKAREEADDPKLPPVMKAVVMASVFGGAGNLVEREATLEDFRAAPQAYERYLASRPAAAEEPEGEELLSEEEPSSEDDS